MRGPTSWSTRPTARGAGRSVPVRSFASGPGGAPDPDRRRLPAGPSRPGADVRYDVAPSRRVSTIGPDVLPRGSSTRMTQRAKPATPRARRSAGERSSRRTLYLNIAFLGAILLGTATLIGAAFASYAGTHWAEVANINGVSINRDQAQAAANVDPVSYTHQASQLRDDLAAGRISQADYDAQSSTLTQAQQNVSSGVVDALADDELQRQLATQFGISASDQQVDGQLLADAAIT